MPMVYIEMLQVKNLLSVRGSTMHYLTAGTRVMLTWDDGRRTLASDSLYSLLIITSTCIQTDMALFSRI